MKYEHDYKAMEYKKILDEKYLTEDNKDFMYELLDTIYTLEQEVMILKYQKECIEHESMLMLKKYYTNLDEWKRNINNNDYLDFL